MTNQEAIRLLHPDTTEEAMAEIEYYGGFKGHEKTIRALNEASLLACEALEKQVPKKPTDSGLRSGIFKITKCYSCPRCGNVCLRRKANERQDNNYCWDCGQAIDWSKEEDHETD